MIAFFNYVKNIFVTIYQLFQGMYITMLNMTRPKVTDPYPENRGKRIYSASFRALLTMPHDSENFHKCTACGICMMNCPNETIRIVSKKEVDPETGKERKVLDKYIYNLGSCIFCALCTQTCPQGAIEWANLFEHSVFNKNTLVKQLNQPGSSLKKKKSLPNSIAKETVSADNTIVSPKTNKE